MIGIYSKGIASIPYLESFLEEEVVLNPKDERSLSHIAGWGLKPSATTAIKKSNKYTIPYLALEDGFIRSVELGVNNSPPLSLIVDPIGIYYDASRPSLIETILNNNEWVSESILQRADEALEFIRTKKISKYNNHTTGEFKLNCNTKYNILLIDQTANDMSVCLGGADSYAFYEMYNTARMQFPEANIYIKIHPDVIAGKKQGYLTNIKTDSKTKLVRDNVNPIKLIENMDHVFVVTSQLGFEALLMGKKVSTFGIPFYSSWGLTDDNKVCNRRTRLRTIREIFAAAYLLYPKYINPVTGSPGDIMDVLRHIEQQRSIAYSKSKIFCMHIPIWKKQFVRPFLQSETNEIHFVHKFEQIDRIGFRKEDKLLVWGCKEKKNFSYQLQQREMQLWRIEDGFYRSVGLGSNFHTPWSIIIDKLGIYFNPRSENDLETLLNSRVFSNSDIIEAGKIWNTIIEFNLTKYNTDDSCALSIELMKDQKVIFIPGQVENDASIIMGCNDVKSIEELIEIVRFNNPDAYIIYKPHPDVVSKNRNGLIKNNNILKLCNKIEITSSSIDCINVADEVHTLTSQVGFEALLRRKEVYTYGGPFYAGWGLTKDTFQFSRRTRTLSMEELIAGTLIYYTKYYNHDLNQPSDCRSVLRKLARIKQESSKIGNIINKNSKLRQIRKYFHLFREITRRV
ncbi:capsular polysaccharide biosynthesis protein [Paenibacillus tarimensis]